MESEQKGNKMSRTFNVEKNPYDIGNLYTSNKFTFEPGLTVLVGCNGCGKSTLLKTVKSQLEKDNIPVVYFDNLTQGGRAAREKQAFFGNMEFLATSLVSSEGENIVMNMGNTARLMGKLVRENPNAKELWFLLDAIDSGLSIDNIVDIKKYLFDTVFENNEDKDVYIVVSANEYELCNGEKCMDTVNGRYISFADYNEYREFILNSKKLKDEREEAAKPPIRKRRGAHKD